MSIDEGMCRRDRAFTQESVHSSDGQGSSLALYPTKHLLAQGLIRRRVFDFGCGPGMDVAFLRSQGLDVTDYDPHYASDLLAGCFDTTLCHYLLNVLLPEEQVPVLISRQSTQNVLYWNRRSLRNT